MWNLQRTLDCMIQNSFKVVLHATVQWTQYWMLQQTWSGNLDDIPHDVHQTILNGTAKPIAHQTLERTPYHVPKYPRNHTLGYVVNMWLYHTIVHTLHATRNEGLDGLLRSRLEETPEKPLHISLDRKQDETRDEWSTKPREGTLGSARKRELDTPSQSPDHSPGFTWDSTLPWTLQGLVHCTPTPGTKLAHDHPLNQFQ